MAVDLWPYSQRNDGRVSDLEHEALWRPIADGVLPGEPSTALAVSVAGGTWQVQPGRFHIAGHVLRLDDVETGAVPAPASQTRHCIVAAFVDRTTSPWTYGVRLVTGVPGAGRPALQRSISGRYEVALRSFTVAPNGTVNVLEDERPFLTPAGLALPATQRATESTDQTWSSASWTNGSPLCDVTFIAPPSGKVLVDTFIYGESSGTALLIGAFSIRQGSAAGPVVYNNTTYDGPIIRGVAGMSAQQVVWGLSAGQTYYCRMAHRSSANGASVTVRHRRLIVAPLVN